MKIEIDLELLEQLDLLPNEYIALHAKHKADEISEKLDESVNYEFLRVEGWLDDSYEVTDKWR